MFEPQQSGVVRKVHAVGLSCTLDAVAAAAMLDACGLGLRATPVSQAPGWRCVLEAQRAASAPMAHEQSARPIAWES